MGQGRHRRPWPDEGRRAGAGDVELHSPGVRPDAGTGAGRPSVDGRYGSAGRSRLQHARSEENTSELQSLMSTSYAVFCLKKKNTKQQTLLPSQIKTLDQI